MSRILVVDDDRAICRSLQIQLEERGHEVSTCTTGGEGLLRVAASRFDMVFLDLRLPDRSGLKVLRDLLALEDAPEVVMITGVQDMMAMIEAIQVGALDYVRKPLAIEEVLLAVEKAKKRRQPGPARSPHTSLVTIESEPDRPLEIVGKDRQILELLKQVGLLSRSRVTVLIQGESGTGKELVARAIHNASTPTMPFVAINSAAVVATLLESELFGHEKGSFTGADRRKIGKLEQAGGGTVFLDEIGDMPQEVQAKLLRAIQERTFERVGGTEPVQFEARILAASHRDLDGMVAKNTFRADLLYRLSVARLQVPPLRERRGDIRPLTLHLLDRIRRRLGSNVESISEQVLAALAEHGWPGNVRELENVLTRAVALSRGPVIEDIELAAGSAEPAVAGPSDGVKKLWEVERDHIRASLVGAGWNITRTAELLEISPTTLRKKIVDYGLR
ncbi:MAG: sigma-54 dependent transcriptional regulator [Planctomycetota bacterium]